MKWFIDDEHTLISLQALFKSNNIDNFYQGSLLCMKEDLFTLSKDLISYPYILSYKNVDISHSTLPFVIKITNHLTVDLLSTTESLLKEVINDKTFEHLNAVWDRH